ncbi:MAG: primosomal protein N', partial [Clostridia bacterium]|nr:primosomal protein N' [Clostridia bacterium]
MHMIAKVIVDVSNSEVDKVFDYLIPDNSNITVGARVLLPFGARTIEGYVIEIADCSSMPNAKLKPIIKKLDETNVIKPELLSLSLILKEKYHLRLIDCLRLIVPSQIRSNKVKAKIEKKVFINEQKALEYLPTVRSNAKNIIGAIAYMREVGNANYSALASKFSNASINKLIDDGVFGVVKNKVNRFDATKLNRTTQKVKLTETQNNAVNQIISSPKVHLLHGVTGSGKTEVYLDAIEKVLKAGKTAIMLVPEISLTPQMIGIFTARFGSIVAVLHSGLSDGERYDEWFRLHLGEAKIAIGARSAIFAPLENVGIIIIDEEHDSSYISDSNPRYNTFDVALERANYNKCPLVLGSATPSIEDYYNAKIGKFNLIEMPNRVNGKPMPPIEIVDMCSEFRSGNITPFSKTLVNKLSSVIADGKQAMLFINRRGFSSFLMCRDCGYVPSCTSCDISLSYHKVDNELKCHYCGKRFKVINKCPKCGSKNIKLGGVGTEQVVELLRDLYPGLKIFRMDNDTTQTKDSHYKILKAFGETKPSILVGTQMIAKGHDFPSVALVGILDSDLSLYFSDFRATEKTFQLVTQVSGRAGRANINGDVILQTYYPKHYVYKLCAAYNYVGFYDKEINLRETTNFPPFSTILRLLVTSSSDDKAKALAHNLFIKLKDLKVQYKDKFYFLEAMKSPVGKIKNKYRYQLVMRFTDTDNKIINHVYNVVDSVHDKLVSTFVEINPLSLT